MPPAAESTCDFCGHLRRNSPVNCFGFQAPTVEEGVWQHSSQVTPQAAKAAGIGGTSQAWQFKSESTRMTEKLLLRKWRPFNHVPTGYVRWWAQRGRTDRENVLHQEKSVFNKDEARSTLIVLEVEQLKCHYDLTRAKYLHPKALLSRHLHFWKPARLRSRKSSGILILLVLMLLYPACTPSRGLTFVHIFRCWSESRGS